MLEDGHCAGSGESSQYTAHGLSTRAWHKHVHEVSQSRGSGKVLMLSGFRCYSSKNLQNIMQSMLQSCFIVKNKFKIKLRTSEPSMSRYALVDLLSCSGMSCQDAAESLGSRAKKREERTIWGLGFRV